MHCYCILLSEVVIPECVQVSCLVIMPSGSSTNPYHLASPPNRDPGCPTFIILFSCPKAIHIPVAIETSENPNKHVMLSEIISCQKFYVPKATCSLCPHSIEWLLTITSLIKWFSVLPGISRHGTLSVKPSVTNAAEASTRPSKLPTSFASFVLVKAITRWRGNT